MGHRRLGLAAGALALVTAVAPATLPAPAFAGSAAASTSETPLRVATYNIQANRSTADFRSAVEAVLPRADVIGLQEVNSAEKRGELGALAEEGWGSYRPAGRQEPLLWRADRFTLDSARSVKLSEPHFIGTERPNAGPWTRDKYVTVTRLVDKATGERLSFVNVHLVAGAVKAGQPRPERPQLVELYRTQVRALAAVTAEERAWGHVFVLGDFNVGFGSDRRHQVPELPYATFSGLEMPSMWATERPTDGGTRGKALLDQVYAEVAATATSVERDVTWSDHLPAVATYAALPAA